MYWPIDAYVDWYSVSVSRLKAIVVGQVGASMGFLCSKLVPSSPQSSKVHSLCNTSHELYIIGLPRGGGLNIHEAKFGSL